MKIKKLDLNSEEKDFEPKIFSLKGTNKDNFWTLKKKIILALGILLIIAIIISLGLIPVYLGKI